MPIGDLLAQISGDQATARSMSTVTIPPSTSARTKRRAEDSLRYNVSASAPRKTPLGSTKPINCPEKSSFSAAKTSQTLKEAPKGGSIPINRKNNVPTATASRTTVTNLPLLKTTSASDTRKPPPKKGSFAEILARGQRAQAVMGQVGKIQHKKIEKVTTRTKDDGVAIRTKKKGTPTSYSGTARAVPRDGSKVSAQLKRHANAVKGPSSNFDALRRISEEGPAAKKLKKAAIATTGYTGTARPKPVPSQKEAPRGGALLNASRSRFGVAKNSRYKDDYDEELDDFIEYDDDEQDAEGPRYNYASDASSDMEAGLNELDDEERRAEFIARKEDIEEERLEKSLKAIKEARKRKALADLRGAKRS